MHLNQRQLPSVERVEIVPSAAQYDGAAGEPVCDELRLRPHDMSGYVEQRPFRSNEERSSRCIHS